VVVLATRYVSLGSILAAASLAPLMLLFYPGQWALFVFGLVAGVFAIVKHRANIQRLRNGTENRFGKKKDDDDGPEYEDQGRSTGENRFGKPREKDEGDDHKDEDPGRSTGDSNPR
jgi:hypothetical protein